MNLVAKEFVASQDPESPGVLVLSRFAGAAVEMQGGDDRQPTTWTAWPIASRTRTPCRCPNARRRWHALMRRLRRHDITEWRRKFLESLSQQH
jgi:trehalose 6-phosphate synthase